MGNKKKLKFTAYALSAIGTALYLYGYFADGSAALISWPEWASEYVPNLQAELGLAISFIALIPLFAAKPQEE